MAGSIKTTKPKLTAILEKWKASKNIHDYHFFDVKKLIITPKVRLKCMNGCPNYNTAKKCPPNDTLPPEQCKSYIGEYSHGVLLRFYPDQNQLCPTQVQKDLLELERQAFLLNNPFALAIFPKHCSQCEKCSKTDPCNNPMNARFSVSSMCIDILGTMTKLNIGQSILTGKQTTSKWYYIGLVLID
jgi:predicted metal-binding protein